VSATATSTLVDPCAALAGAAAVACRLDAASIAPLCTTGPVGATLATLIHARFAEAAALVRHAATAPRPRRATALLHRADRRLRALLSRIRRATRKGLLAASCPAEIATLIATLRSAIDGL
jgi:hypothetical protein